MMAIHLPTLTVRRVSGERGDIVHFAQVLKYEDGRTEFWATKDEVEMIPGCFHPFCAAQFEPCDGIGGHACSDTRCIADRLSEDPAK
jgi:hypothetical protein